MKTYSTKAGDIKRDWHVVDATDKTLGRLASEVAVLLMGKHKPLYVTHLDVGDYVVVVNAGKIRVTGRKAEQKVYYRHSGYPGGLREVVYKDAFARSPRYVLEHAVRGMLPKNSRGEAMFKKLRVYSGSEHLHQAQIKEKGDN